MTIRYDIIEDNGVNKAIWYKDDVQVTDIQLETPDITNVVTIKPSPETRGTTDYIIDNPFIFVPNFNNKTFSFAECYEDAVQVLRDGYGDMILAGGPNNDYRVIKFIEDDYSAVIRRKMLAREEETKVVWTVAIGATYLTDKAVFGPLHGLNPVDLLAFENEEVAQAFIDAFKPKLLDVGARIASNVTETELKNFAPPLIGQNGPMTLSFPNVGLALYMHDVLPEAYVVSADEFHVVKAPVGDATPASIIKMVEIGGVIDQILNFDPIEYNKLMMARQRAAQEQMATDAPIQ